MICDHNVPEIANSWRRCIDQYKLDSNQSIKPVRLTEAEIRHAQQQFDHQFYSAMPIFKGLSAASKKHHYSIYASDINGTLLAEYSGSIQSYQLPGQVLDLGCVVVEEQVGTNGVGTCLATGESITVHAQEHFSRAYHGLSCSTAPIISAFGEVSGTLSVSAYADSDKSEHDWALKLANDAAIEIEAAIFRSTYGRFHLLELRSQSHGKLLPSNLIIAVNDSDWIVGITTLCLKTLGLAERSLLIGQSLSSILGYSLQDLDRGCALPLEKTKASNKGWYITLTNRSDSPTGSYCKVDAPKPVDSLLYQAAGTDPRLKRNADICHRVINKRINILLMGETGTGKEVWARAIHNSSERSEHPFITLNCAAIPESLIESELFGYSSGTFTGGLKKGKIGKIEASHGGTLFLDEIGDMPLALQGRLLRVLAEGEVTPLGQLEAIKVNFNVICATHNNLLNNVEQGRFREDLYYRVSGVNLTLSPLRERSDRIDVINKVLNNVNDNRQISIDQHAMAMLNKYHWPGNIRQLKNVLNFAVSVCENTIIRITDLPDEVFQASFEQPVLQFSIASDSEGGSSSPHQFIESERERILDVLQKSRWVVLHAAKSLGMSRSTLHRKIKLYGLKED